MKKLLLTSAAIAAFSTSAMASSNSGFYITAGGGVHRFDDLKLSVILSDSNQQSQKMTFTLPTELSGEVQAGVGYNITEQIRTELIYGHHFSPSWKFVTGPIRISLKEKIQTAMAKVYYDVFDFGQAKVFLGAGAGGAKISNKESYMSMIDNRESKKIEFKHSTKNNFTWLLALGSSYNVTESIKVDVQYNYQDFGKTGNITITDNASKESLKVPGFRIRSHSIKAGVRFEI